MPSHPTAAPAGHTIIELLVAVLLLTVGVLGAAGVLVSAERLSAAARSAGLASVAVTSRLEQLRVAPCVTLRTGTAASRGVAEHWVVSPRDSATVSVVEGVDFVAARRGALTHADVAEVLAC
jgi:Tfp pilus assembly protein PilV